jgi:CBS domain-containing protein
VSYSEEDIRNAALRIVTTPTFSSLSNGARNSASTFAQLQELVKTALFYDVDTVFYLISLAAGYYGQRFVTARATLADLATAVDDLKNPTRAIDDVSDVTATRRSLDDVYSALSRDGGISGQTYARFDAASQRGQERIGSAVRVNRVPYGSTDAETFVARPGVVARPEIARKFKSLLTQHGRVLSGSQTLIDAFSDYLSSGIWKAVAQQQVRRARDDAAALEDELEDAATRTEKAQDAVLRLSTMRAVLRSLAEAPTPGSDKYVCDSLSRLIATGSGVAPVVQGTVSAPWRLISGSNSTLSVDVGGSAVSVEVVTADNDVERATLTSVVGPFSVGPDLATPYPMCTKKIPTGNLYNVGGNTLYFTVDGTLFLVPFTVDKDATDVAAAINAATLGAYVTATPQTAAGEDWVEVTYDGVSSPPSYGNRFLRVVHGASDAADLAPWRAVPIVGSEVVQDWSYGHDANNELRIQANSSATTILPLTSGAWPSYTRTAAQVAADIMTGGAGAFVAYADADQRIVILSGVFGEGSVLTMRSAGVVAGRDTPSARALQMLGFLVDQESRKFSTPLQVVLDALNNDAAFSAVAVADAVRETVLHGAATMSDPYTISLSLDSDPAWTTLSDKVVVVGSGDNRGAYTISSYSWVGGVLTLVLSRALRTTTTDSFVVTIRRELLKLLARDASVSSYLTVNTPAGSIHSTTGLPTVQTFGTTSQVAIQSSATGEWVGTDLRRKSIRVGDEILTSGVFATVTGVGDIAIGVLDVTPVPSDTVLTAFTINSVAFRLYTDFIDQFSSWFSSLGPYAETDLRQLSRSITGLMTRAPSVEQIDAALSALSTYDAALAAGLALLRGYKIAPIASVDDALNTMTEHGHDRAREMLLQCAFTTFAAMTIRDSSFSRAFMNTASQVAVYDANEPTTHRDPNATEYDRAQGGVVTLADPQYDFESEANEPDSQLLDFWPVVK